jgi:hypothetical protein
MAGSWMRIAAAALAASIVAAAGPAAAQFPFGRSNNPLGGIFGAPTPQNNPQYQQNLQNSDPRSRMTQGGDQQQDTAAGPVALLEAIADAPGAGFESFDYLDAGATLDLGARGTATISYFEGCRVEKIRGGTVTIGPRESAVAGGQVSASTMACKGAKPIVVASAREAGAGVNRVTPFPASRWDEWSVKSDRPVFAWPAAAGESAQTVYRVTVIALDQKPPQIVWAGDARQRYLPYAPAAPRLAPGMPYAVQVAAPGGTPAESVFSIDPDLDIADTPANRVVPVRR